MDKKEATPLRVLPPTQAKAMVVKEALDNPSMKPRDIALKLGIPIRTVCSWMKDVDIKKKADEISAFVERAVLEDKVPILRAIGDVGLIALFEWTSKFIEEKKHLNMPIAEAKQLTSMIESLHSMYRLELGKSTVNVDYMIQKTSLSISAILSNLQKPPEQGGDPFGVPPKVIDVETQS